MTRSGLLTETELNECRSLLDDPQFLDIRSIGIAAWGQTMRMTIELDDVYESAGMTA